MKKHKKLGKFKKKMAVKRKVSRRKLPKISRKVITTCDDLLSTLSVDDLHSLVQEINSGLTDKRASRFCAIPKTTMKSLVKEVARLDEGLSLTVNLEMPITADIDFYWDYWSGETHMEITEIYDDPWSFVTEEVVMKKSKGTKDKVSKMKKDVKVLLKKIKDTAEQYDVNEDDLLSEVQAGGPW